jgi:sarcosine oxidase, subunit beta
VSRGAAVIGAGITGLAVARALAERGVDVVVLERDGIAAGASGVQPGGVRQQWGTAVACRLARESVDFWRDADERLRSRVELGFRACGYLFAALSDETLQRLAENVGVQNAEGIPSRLVSSEEAAQLVPGLEPIAGGAWCADDGYFDRPQSVVEAFAEGLEVERARADALVRDGSGWRIALADGASVTAESVVVAAGVESAALVAPLGLELPLAAEDRYLFFSDRLPERLLEPLVVVPELRFAAKQLADGRVLASDLGARGDAGARDEWRAAIRAAVQRIVPLLSYVSYPTLVRGVYDVTPDHQPVLGPVPGCEGLFVAAGFSGHGFMIAPAVARIVADALEGVVDPALETLGVERFAAGRLVPEPQLV